MATATDYTLKDNNRRNLTYLNINKVHEVLPSYFVEDHPKLITFLEKYYQFLDSDGSPSRQIDELYFSRDITQTDDSLLDELEDEYLLGQSYFKGFRNKRAAAKAANNLYRSKGTQFSIQQFFRMFFETDPVVEYTKERRLMIGPGPDSDELGEDGIIGFEAQRFITNDKLYQTFAIAIRIGIPVSLWRDVYKLFVHPAGMYFEGEVLIETFNDPFIPGNMPNFEPAPIDITVQGEAQMTMLGFGDVTGLEGRDSANDNPIRVSVPGNRFDIYKDSDIFDSDGSMSIRDVSVFGRTLLNIIDASSPTMDDSGGTSLGGADSDRILTFDHQRDHIVQGPVIHMDAVDYPYYDSDSA